MNNGLKVMYEISCVFGGDLAYSEKPEDVSINDIVCYKYARLVSCDAERTFSQYKSLLCDNRHRLKTHSLKMTFAVRCNSASFIFCLRY
jgi:hypothetical protein